MLIRMHQKRDPLVSSDNVITRPERNPELLSQSSEFLCRGLLYVVVLVVPCIRCMLGFFLWALWFLLWRE